MKFNLNEWLEDLPMYQKNLHFSKNFKICINISTSGNYHTEELFEKAGPSDSITIWKYDKYVRVDTRIRDVDNLYPMKKYISFYITEKGAYIYNRTQEFYQEAQEYFRNIDFKKYAKVYLKNSVGRFQVDCPQIDFKDEKKHISSITCQKSVFSGFFLETLEKDRNYVFEKLNLKKYINQKIKKVRFPLNPPSKKKEIKITSWMAKDFPISIVDFIVILKTINPLSKDISVLTTIFNGFKQLNNKHFPIQLHIPMDVGFNMHVTLSDYKEFQPKDQEFLRDIFRIPANVKERKLK